LIIIIRQISKKQFNEFLKDFNLLNQEVYRHLFNTSSYYFLVHRYMESKKNTYIYLMSLHVKA